MRTKTAAVTIGDTDASGREVRARDVGARLAGEATRDAQPYVIGLFRIVVAFLFVCHGAATIFDVLGGAYGGQPAVGSWPSWWAALIQLVCGALVAIGLVTRPAAVLASGSMAYAYFTKHQPHELFPIENGGEAAVMFCWTFLLIALLGPGRLALDTLVQRARAKRSGPGGVIPGEAAPRAASATARPAARAASAPGSRTSSPPPAGR